MKGKPNLTIGKFCQWVNEIILPNVDLEPGFSRKISIETAHRWKYELGFVVVTAKKGAFVDGHEKEDVVEYWKIFHQRMVTLIYQSF